MKFYKNPFQSSFVNFFTIFSILNFLLRIVFLFWQRKEIDFISFDIIQCLTIGIFFDFVTFCYLTSIFYVYFILTPSSIFNHHIHQKINRVLYYIFISIIIFSFVSEVVFWDEFQARFNFIAVDYLIYTTEVINNIVESYPIIPIFLGIFFVAYILYYYTNKRIISSSQELVFYLRLKCKSIIPVLCLIFFFTIDSSKLSKISNNNYINEISTNGIYQLFSAYRNNKVNFMQLYSSINEGDAIKMVRDDILKQEPNSKFLDKGTISRHIKSKGLENSYNIIFVSIESFSADFMSYFGNKENLTPNLDKLAKQGLFFTNLKATGTRTVRGLEALTLSVPPTPGNSIVRRPNNENLFNISTPFKDRGYDVSFIYGGYGYFDNMNYFYENNGFKIVDRAKFNKGEITFENAWGVSDEDLFDKTIKEADISYNSGKNFFSFVMTTSNHRPFTYPDNKIDIPSKSGRNGAVKYTDYAIAQLIKKSQQKKWFDNTIFVFVADHCAGSAGNTDVPLWRYQIPAIIYAPKIVKPRIFDKNISQIDIAPTLIGLTNFSYESKFYGTDVIKNEKNISNRAFVSTYLDVGFYKNNKLFLLKPKKEIRVFDVDIKGFGYMASEEVLTKNYSIWDKDLANAYYQSAYFFYENGLMKNKNIDVSKRN